VASAAPVIASGTAFVPFAAPFVLSTVWFVAFAAPVITSGVAVVPFAAPLVINQAPVVASGTAVVAAETAFAPTHLTGFIFVGSSVCNQEPHRRGRMTTPAVQATPTKGQL
jgi:hypothetical protein